MNILDAFPGFHRDPQPYEPGKIDIARYARLHDERAFREFHYRGVSIRDIRPEAIHHIDKLRRDYDVRDMVFTDPFTSQATSNFELTSHAMQRPDMRAALRQARERALFTLTRVDLRSPELRRVVRPGDVLVASLVIPRLESSFAYAIALHEFGHVHGQVTDPAQVSRTDEFTASQWAVDNAAYWNRNMTDGLLAGLWTYVSNPSPHGTHEYTRAQFEAFAHGPVAARELRG